MKKILSLVVFTVALVWSWSVIHSASAIGIETHSGIQDRLATLIQQTVQQKKPAAQDIQVVRLWTETLDENKVRAVFAYRFTEMFDGGEKSEQTVEGEAILHREPSEDSRIDRWVLQNVRTTNDIVTFDQGAVVTPARAADETVDPTAPAGTADPATEGAN